MTLEPLIIEADQGGQRKAALVNAWMLHWSPSNVDELQSRVRSARWQWRLIDGPDADEISTVVDQVRVRYNEATAGRGSWTQPEKVLLAVGPRGGRVSAELQRIAQIGRAVGVVIVAASELLDSGRSTAEFRSNFTGYWAPFVPYRSYAKASFKADVTKRN